MSPWGKSTERFHIVTNNFNANPRATLRPDHQHSKDCFQLVAKSFEASEKNHATKTGTKEVLTPIKLLLVDVAVEMNGLNDRTAAERREMTAAAEELVKNGEQFRHLAMATRVQGHDDLDSDELQWKRRRRLDRALPHASSWTPGGLR